jgi:uncharacterized protein YndB with AHSA1/START domain
MNTDRIEKSVLLRAPLDRVWNAISDSSAFGQWFGMRFDGPFVAGKSVRGVIAPTAVDEKIACRQEPHAGTPSTWEIVALEPRSRFAFRWHPYGVDEDTDYSAEPTTLVEFTLEEQADGVLLRIIESGFDQIPEARRRTAFDANSEGWAAQVELVQKYLGLRAQV